MGICDPRDCDRRCENCRKPAEVDRLCALCAMQAAVDDGDKDRALSIAEDCGYPESTVYRMVRDHNERKMACEVSSAIASGKAPAVAPTARAKTRAMRAATRD